ncbi:hypothetical protein JVT61DRAFT_6973 [Boletus reticuloceps]|uniref:Uncharacterized protein n=1 Tax=Boletus reticuloceps TaxID=495285 RepID=A0A8I2YJV9_9AGAM|nr:hypothetical protein JVT61DRAFT_6973 [Boletus reticuloceps]
MVAPRSEVSVFLAPEPKLCTAVTGSRFSLQVEAPKPPSFVGPQSTHDYKQQRIRYQGRPQTTLECGNSGHHQSGMRNENAVQGTPAKPHASSR